VHRQDQYSWEQLREVLLAAQGFKHNREAIAKWAREREQGMAPAGSASPPASPSATTVVANAVAAAVTVTVAAVDVRASGPADPAPAKTPAEAPVSASYAATGTPCGIDLTEVFGGMSTPEHKQRSRRNTITNTDGDGDGDGDGTDQHCAASPSRSPPWGVLWPSPPLASRNAAAASHGDFPNVQASAGDRGTGGSICTGDLVAHVSVGDEHTDLSTSGDAAATTARIRHSGGSCNAQHQVFYCEPLSL